MSSVSRLPSFPAGAAGAEPQARARGRWTWAIALAIAASSAASGCSHTTSKGHEVLRVGPLRGVRVVPDEVSPAPVALDAGTDALTDDELDSIARALPRSLQDALARLDRASESVVRAGKASIVSCRLRAGPSRDRTVYAARCRVKVTVDEVPLLAVEAEAVRHTPTRLLTTTEASTRGKQARDPLLVADDARQTLTAALEAAALLVVDEAIPTQDGGPRRASRSSRAALARERMARLGAQPTAEEDLARAALFDLGNSGAPADAALAHPFLSHDRAEVRRVAADTLGELCSGSSASALEAALAIETEDARVRAAAERALARVRSCSRLPHRP